MKKITSQCLLGNQLAVTSLDLGFLTILVYHHALAGKFPHVWDLPQVLFSGQGTEATDTYVKAQEKSTVKLFATCQRCSVGGRRIILLHNNYCYTPRFSLNKTRIVIGWFLVTCPWSNSNVSWLGYKFMEQLLSSHCTTTVEMTWSSAHAHIISHLIAKRPGDCQL